jgi:hypothetical protein
MVVDFVRVTVRGDAEQEQGEGGAHLAARVGAAGRTEPVQAALRIFLREKCCPVVPEPVSLD